jgi:hypothetical protein
VGLGNDSRLLSAQSHPTYPSVTRLPFDIETVKTFISCFNIIAEQPEASRQVLVITAMIHSAQDVQPYLFMAFLLPSLTPSAKFTL